MDKFSDRSIHSLIYVEQKKKKNQYKSSDLGKWVDMVGGCGMSFLITSIFTHLLRHGGRHDTLKKMQKV